MDKHLDNKKSWNAWCMYDWANSVHNLVIISVIFPIYYHIVTGKSGNDNLVDFFGWQVNNDSLYSYTISAASLLMMVLSPILTSIADYSGKRKLFMKVFCYLGAFCCGMFYFFTKENLNLGMVAFGLSIVGWGGSVVFYNSYIPQIASEKNYDRLSARGFVFGYIGSVLLLITNLALIMKPEWFGLTEADTKSGFTSRLAFVTVGIWWAGFAQIPFYVLPKDNPIKFEFAWIKKGLLTLSETAREISKSNILLRFLVSYFFYYMGVMTTIYVATIFAEKELKIPTEGLITTLLLIQFIAIPGSYFASWLSKKVGNMRALSVEVFIWLWVPVGAYFTRNTMDFYVIAAVVGFVMGGIQSLSRSTFAKLLPEGHSDTSSYFSFYDVLEKASIMFGTFLFGFINGITHNMRTSILFMVVTFFISLVILLFLPSKKVYHTD
ncbi:MAG: MFS transporter [Leadbetterella sp.]